MTWCPQQRAETLCDGVLNYEIRHPAVGYPLGGSPEAPALCRARRQFPHVTNAVCKLHGVTPYVTHPTWPQQMQVRRVRVSRPLVTHTHAQTALHSSRILHQVEPLFLLWAL